MVDAARTLSLLPPIYLHFCYVLFYTDNIWVYNRINNLRYFIKSLLHFTVKYLPAVMFSFSDETQMMAVKLKRFHIKWKHYHISFLFSIYSNIHWMYFSTVFPHFQSRKVVSNELQWTSIQWKVNSEENLAAVSEILVDQKHFTCYLKLVRLIDFVKVLRPLSRDHFRRADLPRIISSSAYTLLCRGKCNIENTKLSTEYYRVYGAEQPSCFLLGSVELGEISLNICQWTDMHSTSTP